MDEEEDYMSDDFIAKCLNSANDVRPGLLKTHNQKREHDMMKKKKESDAPKKKSSDEIQTEVLEESLKQPINSSNKGFSMLEKMGFKNGMGLGKNNSGIVEPISLNIKKDRKGLGHKKPQRLPKTSKREEISEGDYRAFLSRKNKEREVMSDLRKSQRICRELDLKFEKEPDMSWYWPKEEAEDKEKDKNEVEEEVEEDDDEELSNEEKLELITKYLRETYYYCVWCKVKYEDEKDMEDCPGFTRDDH